MAEIEKILKELLKKQSTLQTLGDRADETSTTILTKLSNILAKQESLELAVKAISDKLENISLAKGAGKKAGTKAVDPSGNVAGANLVAPAKMLGPWTQKLIKADYDKNKNIDDFLQKYIDAADLDAIKTKVANVPNEGVSYAGDVLEFLEKEYFKNANSYEKRGDKQYKKLDADHKAAHKKFNETVAAAEAAKKKTAEAPAASSASDDFH